ncbi:hypothetical protein DFH09DRAFT_1493919 [Mycena vulgaris]|nr:hypothetical protein DFH09DRAFT_1493919 [Mycena vulgaris]
MHNDFTPAPAASSAGRHGVPPPSHAGCRESSGESSVCDCVRESTATQQLRSIGANAANPMGVEAFVRDLDANLKAGRGSGRDRSRPVALRRRRRRKRYATGTVPIGTATLLREVAAGFMWGFVWDQCQGYNGWLVKRCSNWADAAEYSDRYPLSSVIVRYPNPQKHGRSTDERWILGRGVTVASAKAAHGALEFLDASWWTGAKRGIDMVVGERKRSHRVTRIAMTEKSKGNEHHKYTISSIA